MHATPYGVSFYCAPTETVSLLSRLRYLNRWDSVTVLRSVARDTKAILSIRLATPCNTTVEGHVTWRPCKMLHNRPQKNKPDMTKTTFMQTQLSEMYSALTFNSQFVVSLHHARRLHPTSPLILSVWPEHSALAKYMP